MVHQLPTLWQSTCESSCHAYRECGGSASAPCGCIFAGTDAAYRCDSCWRNCRERIGSEPGDVGESHYSDGLALNELQIANSQLSLPPFIPMVTRELPRGVSLDAVGAGLGDIFTRNPTSRIRMSRHLGSPAAFRRRLRCRRDGTVLGILNGTDRALEFLWNADISMVASRLIDAGFLAVTGPTFSILDEPNVTSYHNLTMLRRHHQVVQRLHSCGVEVVPNLYWRDPRGLRQWQHVLAGAEIHAVSRDFSRTRRGASFDAQFDGLLALLHAVGRPMRVIVAGVGIRKAVAVSRQIQALGCAATIVTTDPVRLAINRGAEVFRRPDGDLSARVRADLSREALALRNIKTLGRELSRLIVHPRQGQTTRQIARGPAPQSGAQ